MPGQAARGRCTKAASRGARRHALLHARANPDCAARRPAQPRDVRRLQHAAHVPSGQCPPSSAPHACTMACRFHTALRAWQVQASQRTHAAAVHAGPCLPASPCSKVQCKCAVRGAGTSRKCHQRQVGRPGRLVSAAAGCAQGTNTVTRHIAVPRGSSAYASCCRIAAAGDNPDQSQIVCNGCRVLLSYPRGAQSVQCSLCQTVTQVRLRTRQHMCIFHLAALLSRRPWFVPGTGAPQGRVSHHPRVCHLCTRTARHTGACVWPCALWRLQHHADVPARRAVSQMLSVQFCH